MKRFLTLFALLMCFILLLIFTTPVLAEGSRTLAPNYSGTGSLVAPSPTNQLAWLEHDGPDGFSGDFLDPAAGSNQRLYIRMQPGETLHYGLRRIAVRYDNVNSYLNAPVEGNNQDLTVVIYDNAGNIVHATFFDRDAGSTGEATLQTAYSTSGIGTTNGIISTVASSLVGPQFDFNTSTINSGGYSPQSYTNNTGSDQDFYVAFIQDDYTFTSYAQLISDIQTSTITDTDIRSWYDLWDFSVYDGNEEKPGRMHCKRWNLNVQDLENVLADEVNFYAQVPSVINGVNQGNYIKRIDLGGLAAFSLIVYANSQGSDGTDGDLNGDGTTDFQDTRRSTDSDIGQIEYDMFINNPDLELYPTTILPTISISDAVFFCNPSNSGGQAAITFESNQVGQVAILVDINGVNGFQANTEDRIIEAEITSEGYTTIIWDGLDGLGAIVPNGSDITISGRFTAGPIHVPLWDVEANTVGINMLDVRPSTSFDLIYWDDSDVATGANPEVELDGTNTSLHTWTDGDEFLVNTWSFGFYEVNTENVTFTYSCDDDNDGVSEFNDNDLDNDGIPNSTEGDALADTDGDGIPDYLDADLSGYVDINGDGINDTYDADLDGIPNALDLDSDNDGIPDVVEAGASDTNNDGQADCGGSYTVQLTVTDDGGSSTTHSGTVSVDPYGTSSTSFTGNTSGTVDIPGTDQYLEAEYAEYTTTNFTTVAGTPTYVESLTNSVASAPTGDDDRIRFNFNISQAGTYRVWARLKSAVNNSIDDDSFWVTSDVAGGTYTKFNAWNNAAYTWVQLNDYDVNTNGTAYVTYTFSTGDHYIDFAYRENGARIDMLFLSSAGTTPAGTPAAANVPPTSEISVVSTSGNVPFTVSFDGTASSDPDGTINGYDWDFGDGTSSTSSTSSKVFNVGSGEIIDLNSNGQCDYFDSNPLAVGDTDGDGIADYLDLDSDNDGITDTYENNLTVDINTGRIAFTDTDADGLNDDFLITPTVILDSDGDSYPDYRDIDSDNDGIPDNMEAQSSSSTVDITTGDSDSNGLLDVYDPANDGTLLTPVDTDADSEPDYQDTDADGDGVADVIEGWDADFNGFGDWDATGSNNDISDEIGYNTDSDSDGLLNIFDNTASSGIANIVGSDVVLQNTDGSDNSDWQDDDDDNDGSLTAGEDVNNDNDWTNDFTQGQGGSATIPDYLFRGDYDGDGISDKNDNDSDNDGIPDSIETNGESIDPSGDDDNDGIANYHDVNIAGSLSNATDSNGDGVFDVFDTDLDGVPDFLDLDSDNDGLWDAVEAYEGSIPNGLNQTSGQFTLNDPDNDGLMNYIDSSPAAFGGSSTLANSDSDGDGLRDYVDIDSDGDGIVDLIESQSTSNLIQLTNSDTDGDGIDDAFDPDQGGVLITPVNSDGLDLQDYLDSDSDNDSVLDIVEGSDINNDGFGDWDDDENGATNEADLSTDTDGDGLSDAFDNIVLGATGNSTGSNATLQNTDGLDELDFRDTDDDADGILTINEDANSNGNLQDDQSQANGIPDYLFNGDYDKDGILDSSDSDSDNDGVADVDEDGGQSIDPSGDEDGDGIPNFRDMDDPTVSAALTSTADANGDWVYDVFDTDLDGVPDFRDADSDNDGIPDLIEVGGVDTDGNGIIDGLDDSDGDGLPDTIDVDNTGGADSDGDGIDDAFDFSVSGGTDTDGDDIIDSADTDIDGDGLPNTYDPDNGGTALIVSDTDGDGINDLFDLDSDNDGIPDLVEAGGTDTDGNGKVDDDTDSDNDGLADILDTDSGGTALTSPDSDHDGYIDCKDLDSDNDGITDAIENGVNDTNSDGLIDSYAIDTDGNGLADAVDPDNGGTAIVSRDTDEDGIDDYLDLDSDNDGYPDIVEGGGTDSDYDGVVDDVLDIDQDGIPANVDVDQTGGTDADGDGIDDLYDVTYTSGNDDDNDGIDDSFDYDTDGNGFSDSVESVPYNLLDSDNDGIKDFRDLDSDNDGIVDVIEFGLSADTNTGGIASFTDTDNDGFNDTQDGYIGTTVNASVVPINPMNSDNGSEPVSAVVLDYLDIDSDNDGIPDIKEAQTKATYIALSGVDSNKNGLDDAFDPIIGNTLITPVNTDGTGNADYLDTDSDDDGVLDRIEGHNSDKNLFADWDADQDSNFDDSGFDTDTDEDGLLDIYDNVASKGASNVIGSTAAVQDTDLDGTWDFQDVDDDNDGINTVSEAITATADPNGIIPDYLYGDPDTDGDGVNNIYDLDQDNDGLANASEDGGTGIDPSADSDGDGLYNYQDSDIDGDGTANKADTNTSGINTTGFTDLNADGIIDQFDQDYDGIPDFRDRDSDNDGIADIIEFGLADANEDGSLDEGTGITDANGNGLDDTYDDTCDGSSIYAGSFTNNGGTNPANAIGNTPTTFAQVANGNSITFDLGVVIPTGSTVVLSLNDGAAGINATANITQSLDGTTFSNLQLYSATTGVGSGTGPENFNYVLTSYSRYINIEEESGTNRPVNIHMLSYVVPCSGGTAVTISDTDGDGLNDYLDLDSDADGIADNVEAQLASSYVSPAAGDTDGDGILNVYDEDVSAGNALDPIDSDGDTTDDFLDTDSDDDGIDDVIEAWDADQDGFGDWDTDGDNDPTDETGYLSDNDGDGFSYLFDNSTAVTTIANITGSSAPIPDTDGDNTNDYRDNDDDDDGILTSAEDVNSNMDWTDDLTQGGGTVPNYLYRADADGDGISNNLDPDTDGDGIPNAMEYVGVTYTDNSSPYDDDDADGIYNYLDSDANGFIDSNADGIDDRVDKDRDGIPNFIDLDSDNDGILDSVENTPPTNYALSSTPTASSVSGAYGSPLAVVIDGDTDGNGEAQNNHTNQDLEAYIELDLGAVYDVSAVTVWNRTDCCSDRIDNFYVFASDVAFTATDVTTTLAQSGVTSILQNQEAGSPSIFTVNTTARYIRVQLTETDFLHLAEIQVFAAATDTDSDGTPNYLDLDSDNDGITDNREAQTTAAYVAITNADTDGDGLKDVYDADNGGVAITPTDTDSDSTPDYLDTDSDGDNVLDIVEGFDANKNGYSDLDLDLDGDLSDETNYGTDQDGDGLEKLFDNYSGYGINNITGSKATLQDTDGDGLLDWRDNEDDADGLLTTGEDANSDLVYYNDKTQGGGATPDYLYANDTDGDGIIDGLDLDSDNDGITDAVEFNGATYATASDDPFDDDDGDGILNYRDSNAANFVDTNSDGIDDRVDADQDGIPNFFDLDSDNDGIPDTIEGNGGTDPGLSGNDNDGDGLDDTVDSDDGGSALTVPDTDSDGIPDYLDLDSDNDGLTDLLEAGGDDYNGDGKLDSFGDTDGDGLGNSVDTDNGGTALTYPDTDSDGEADYIDSNSDNDPTPDYQEAYFEAGPTNYSDSYANRVSSYNTANAASGFSLYPTDDLSPANGRPDYLDDTDGDGLANLFDSDSPFFFDEDGDGLINLFDPDQNGNFYAQVSGAPDRDSDGIENYLDGDDVPLPLDFLGFEGKELNGNIGLIWQTTNEVNVSHFEVEHSLTGKDFKVIGTKDAVNEKDGINTYSFVDQRASMGYNYYRIKEVDFDGYFDHTEIIYVIKEESGISWTLYPNPTTDRINIQSNVIIPDVKVSLINMSGKVVYRELMKFGDRSKSIDLSNMTSGVYQLILELPNEKQQFRVIVK